MSDTFVLTYCANGCTRREGDDHIRVTTTAPSQLCDHCCDRLERWLAKIPDLYALLPVFLQPGSVERNPESSATKAATVAAPVRLEIVDLLDVRRGRRGEEGDEPTVDRRGVAGTLKVHLDNLIADRPLTTVKDLTSVSRAVDLLQKHLAWLCEQDYAADLYDDIRLLHRQLSDATGDYRRPAVAVCTVADEDGNNCGGSIQANQYGGAYCSRCHTTWKPDQLRHLGLALAISQEA